MLFESLLIGLLAAAPESSAILVRDVEAEAPLAALARETTAEVIGTLGASSAARVLGQRELSLMLEQEELRKALEACDGPDCEAASLQASDINRLVTGRLSRLGSDFVLTLKLSNLASSTFVGGESCIVSTPKELSVCAKAAAEKLLNVQGTAQSYGPLGGAKLAVVPLDVSDVGPSLGATLTEIMLLEVKRSKTLNVISQTEVTAMLEFEAERQIVNCENNVACLLEIGGALKVDLILGGAIGKLDDTYVLHLKLMDIKRGEVVRRVSESLLGEEADLAAAIRIATRKLLGSQAGGSGRIQVLFDRDEDEAAVSIDGLPTLTLSSVASSTLAVGKHAISIRVDGYQPVHREFFIEPDYVTRLRSVLSPLPDEWFEKWWVWAIVGGTVAAAGGAALAASQTNQPNTGSIRGVVEYPFD